MSPGMTGNEKTFDFDAVNVKYLPIVQQYLFVVDRDLRQFIEMIDDFSPHLDVYKRQPLLYTKFFDLYPHFLLFAQQQGKCQNHG